MALDYFTLFKSVASYPVKWIVRLFDHPELDIEVSDMRGGYGNGRFCDLSQFRDGL